MIILVDNGHGRETAGKRSPDGLIKEWRVTRRLAADITAALVERGYDARRLVPEEEDVPLRERVERANAVCKGVGSQTVVLVSVHLNAAGNGSHWAKARGWQVHVAPQSSFASIKLATALADAAAANGLTVRKVAANVPFWTQELAICRNTFCPTVLTENLFMDNTEDAALLRSEQGRAAIVKAHVDGLINYIER